MYPLNVLCLLLLVQALCFVYFERCTQNVIILLNIVKYFLAVTSSTGTG